LKAHSTARLKRDDRFFKARARDKMEDLIRAMENLEGSMVAIAADAVHQVMNENRKALFD